MNDPLYDPFYREPGQDKFLSAYCLSKRLVYFAISSSSQYAHQSQNHNFEITLELKTRQMCLLIVLTLTI